MSESYKYDVGISFAEEDRNAALALALAFELSGIKKVYYYPDQRGATLGKPLRKELVSIYSKDCRYTVMLLSNDYARKPLAKVERKAIIKRLNSNEGITVIPVLLDSRTNLSEFPELDHMTYVEWNYKPKEIAEILKAEFGIVSKSTKEKSSILVKQINLGGSGRDMKNSATIIFH